MFALWFSRVCLFVGLGIDAWLAWLALSGKTLAGCGESGSCSSVLASVWAYSFYIPVTLFAALVHASLLVCTFDKLEKPAVRLLFGALCWLIQLATLWFLSLMIWKLGQFCLFCLVAHSLGVAAVMGLVWFHRERRAAFLAWRPFIAGIAGMMVLVVGQVAFPAEWLDVYQPTSELTTASTEPQPQRVHLLAGLGDIDPADFPHLGNPQSEHVLALLYDYPCGHCREAFQNLRELVNKSPATLCVIILPVPTASACNPYVGPEQPQSADSCDYARLAMVLFLTDRALLREFNDVFLGEGRAARPFAEALTWAQKKLPDASLQDLMRAKEVAAALQFNISIFAQSSEATDRITMPKIITSKVIVSGAPSSMGTLEENLDPATGAWWTGE